MCNSTVFLCFGFVWLVFFGFVLVWGFLVLFFLVVHTKIWQLVGLRLCNSYKSC